MKQRTFPQLSISITKKGETTQPNYRCVGSERINRDGYVEVKIKEKYLKEHPDKLKDIERILNSFEVK